MIRVLLASSVLLSVGVASRLLAANPEGSSARVVRGQQAYLAYCAMCHGARGSGDGEVAAALKRSNIVVPRLDDAARLVRVGRAGVLRIILEGGAHVGRSNVMPEWGGLVGQSLANDLADYVMSLSERGTGLSSVTLERYLKSPPGVPGEGRRLYVFHCSACHGPSGHGNGPSGEVLRRKHGIRPRDLADARFMRSRTDKDLFAAISLGGTHLGKSAFMPSWTNDLTPPEIKDLVAYLRQISKTPARP
jgi:mono/diheme cytochrome c family protein